MNWEIEEEKLIKFKIPLIILFWGVIFLGLGFLFLKIQTQETPKIEIISSEENSSKNTIFVDLQGAVEKPGVYELPTNSRINDLLIRAGGLSASADRDWVSKNINLAQKLTDGIKIYIPTQDEVRKFGGPGISISQESGGVAGVSSQVSGKININTASQFQLESLWGIGPSRAKAIIANRPYQNIEELVTKAKIPQSVFEKIKDQITTY
ncbi:MAG: helix-hairpin-helix domain-containing protein [Microgenomates group bacterium]